MRGEAQFPPGPVSQYKVAIPAQSTARRAIGGLRGGSQGEDPSRGSFSCSCVQHGERKSRVERLWERRAQSAELRQSDARSALPASLLSPLAQQSEKLPTHSLRSHWAPAAGAEKKSKPCVKLCSV